MFSKRTTLAVSAGLTVAVCSTALAGNPFKGLTTTEGGYHTWDSDLINVDAVSQTGHGVYVAVLDTGMVPNWRDYFPEARVATHLGTGFDQPVTFRGSKDNPCGIEVEVGQLQQTTWVGSTARLTARTSRARFSATAIAPIPTRPADSRCRQSRCAALRRT